MTISKEQREKNTKNKLFHVARDSYDHPANYHKSFGGRKQGTKGQEVVRAARNLSMDDASGGYDYSGDVHDYRHHQYTLSKQGINNDPSSMSLRRAMDHVKKQHSEK